MLVSSKKGFSKIKGKFKIYVFKKIVGVFPSILSSIEIYYSLFFFFNFEFRRFNNRATLVFCLV